MIFVLLIVAICLKNYLEIHIIALKMINITKNGAGILKFSAESGKLLLVTGFDNIFRNDFFGWFSGNIIFKMLILKGEE